MKTARILIVAAIVLSLICASLIGYIAHGHNAQDDCPNVCLPPLSVFDFTWSVSDISQYGRINRHYAGVRFAQDGWGEIEFAILNAAINSFVPFEKDFRLPWDDYHSIWRHRIIPMRWQGLWRWRGDGYIIVPPLDLIFTLQATKEVQMPIEYGDYVQITIDIEEIQFIFSHAYGAFAATRLGNIPRGNICSIQQFFHVDLDAFLWLYHILEYEHDHEHVPAHPPGWPPTRSMPE